DSKASYVLSNVAVVVERILTFVPTKSLLRIASVCKLWKNCARRVLRTQQQLSYVSASGRSKTGIHVLCNTLAEDVEKVFLLPKTVLAMVDCDTLHERSIVIGLNEGKLGCKSPDMVDVLSSLLPKSCDIMGISTPGIVLTPCGSSSSPPQEHQEGEAGFAIMLPSMDGVHVKPFHFCKNSISPTALKEAGLVDNPDLRVVLLFVYSPYQSGGRRFLKQLLDPLGKSKALIAGGIVESAFSPRSQCCDLGGYGVVGLALSGPKVQGASVLLDQDVVNPKGAEATVRRLKAAKIPEGNTLGLMFACVGRGRSYYNQSDVESSAFRKVFPTVPLFGLFGNGEIGCDRIVKDDYTLCDSDRKSLQHQYTTVMTLVHFG
ncbi:unnamed protein product, partial [Tetraodon nigroviridis]